MNPVGTRQLPLELKLPVHARLEDFVSNDADSLCLALRALLSDSAQQFMLISGPAGSGKTHLLSSVCHLADQQQLSVIYLPLADFQTLSPHICEGLESADLVCLDDIDAIAGLPEWETALFHLYNRLRDSGRKMLASAASPALQLPLKLPDLRSRLAWGINLQLHDLSDTEKQQLLQQRAHHMGMEMPDETAGYLLNHHGRQLSSLLETLELLERASMAAKRKLTVPFVKSVLQEMR